MKESYKPIKYSEKVLRTCDRKQQSREKNHKVVKKKSQKVTHLRKKVTKGHKVVKKKTDKVVKNSNSKSQTTEKKSQKVISQCKNNT